MCKCFKMIKKKIFTKIIMINIYKKINNNVESKMNLILSSVLEYE